LQIGCCFLPRLIWTTIQSHSSFFFFFGGGTELRALHVQSKHPYCLGHTSSLFCFVYFWRWCSLKLLAWLAWNPVLLISVSQVARVTGVSHWYPAQIFFNE
jgi:hypothetical protein